MQNRWKVASETADGQTVYTVYKLIDGATTDLDFNREYQFSTTSKEKALFTAQEFNREGFMVSNPYTGVINDGQQKKD